MRNPGVMRRSGAVLLLLLTVTAVGVLCVAAGPKPDVEPALADLAWMAGHWEGESGSTTMEEIWIEPKGGMMLGLHRDVSTSGGVMFEFLRIVEDKQGIAYLASPRGKSPPTRFGLAKAGPKRVVFENPDHDFPQRIIYWLGEEGSLHAKIEGDQDGKPAAMEWTWSRRD